MNEITMLSLVCYRHDSPCQWNACPPMNPPRIMLSSVMMIRGRSGVGSEIISHDPIFGAWRLVQHTYFLTNHSTSSHSSKSCVKSSKATWNKFAGSPVLLQTKPGLPSLSTSVSAIHPTTVPIFRFHLILRERKSWPMIRHGGSPSSREMSSIEVFAGNSSCASTLFFFLLPEGLPRPFLGAGVVAPLLLSAARFLPPCFFGVGVVFGAAFGAAFGADLFFFFVLVEARIFSSRTSD